MHKDLNEEDFISPLIINAIVKIASSGVPGGVDLGYITKLVDSTNLSKDDIALIDFLSSIKPHYDMKELENLLSIFFFYIKTFHELKILTNSANPPRNMIAYLTLKLYIDTYELFLNIVYRKICSALENPRTIKQPYRKVIEDSLKNINIGMFCREYRKSPLRHKPAGKIYEILKKLGIIKGNGDSILAEPYRSYRNVITHANVYYDDQTNTIYGTRKIALEELEKAYAKILKIMIILIWKIILENNNLGVAISQE